MKWLGLAAALLLGGGALLVTAYAFWMLWVTNPRVAAELRAQPDGARAQKAMLITLPGGRTLPVNYLREGNAVYAGADGPWWRNLRAPADGPGVPVTLLLRGETLRGHARAITGDPQRTRAVFARLRTGVPPWLPRWLDAVLVVIMLEGKPAPAHNGGKA